MSWWDRHAGMMYLALLADVEEIVAGAGGRDDKLDEFCALLQESVPHYQWVGFYLADEEKRELALDAYRGEPTCHVCIAYGRGVCGRAAEARAAVVIEDVSQEANYLACSGKVKSEAVVPVLKDGRLAAVLDIDSHTAAAFSKDDVAFLERAAAMVARVF